MLVFLLDIGLHEVFPSCDFESPRQESYNKNEFDALTCYTIMSLWCARYCTVCVNRIDLCDMNGTFLCQKVEAVTVSLHLKQD